MARSADLLIRPKREPTRAEREHVQTALPPLQGRENCPSAESVERALCATGYGSLRGIVVTVRGRVVILEGRVPSYYLKQVAQAAALAVAGGHQIRNDMEVERPNRRHQEAR